MRTNSAKQLCLTFLLCLGFWSTSASPDPKVKWQVIETPHFQVIFDSRHYQLAIRYAEASERAFVATESFFSDRPSKTVVVIDDSTDLANGYATGLPYPLITAFPVLPPPMESIADFGNWEQELMMHEYVHILQMEPARGLARPLRSIFGTILRPNMLLPRWYLEGQAVFMETRLSGRGRLRSHNTLALPRALIEAGTLRNETIGRLNETFIPDGVGGQRPYLLGGLLWAEIAKTSSEETLGQLNYDYSGRVPFIINAPVEKRTGFGFAELLEKTYTRIETRANDQVKQIEASGKYPAQLFPLQTGFANHSPEISPDGTRLLFISRTHNSDNRVEVVERSPEIQSFRDGKRKAVATGVSIQRAVWLPDSSGFVYDKIDTDDRYYQYSDLFRYDFATKKPTRITRNLRAREAAISPDGKTLVFVQALPGSTRLAQIDVSGENFKPLYESSRAAVRVSQPEFLSDNEIIFAQKADDGIDDFYVIDRVSGKARQVLLEFRPASFPRMTAEGLMFVSGRSGIDNIYLADRDLKKVRPVTNVTTRAMTAEVDPKTGELFFSRLAGDGPRIHFAEKTAWQDPNLKTPTVPSLLDYEWAPYTPAAAADFDREPKEYRALPHMRPRYWLPFVYFIPEGAYFSASTSGSDPLSKHLYSAQVSYDTLSQKPSFAAQYTNEQTRISYSVFGADINEYIYSSGGFTRHNTMALVAGSFYLSKASRKWKGILGWEYLQTSIDTAAFNDLQNRTGPRVSLSYADVSQRGLEISPEKGGTALASHTMYLPELGKLDYEKTDLAASVYFSKWLPERHAIALFVNGTYAPRLNNLLLGQTTSAARYTSPLLSNDFIMRGYPTSAFIGRTLINTNLEYRFPISYRYKGFGTLPIFLNRIHAAVFADAITVDGRAFYVDQPGSFRTRLNQAYFGYGAELRFDVNAFYYVPMQFILGGFYGADSRAGYGFTPFIGVML